MFKIYNKNKIENLKKNPINIKQLNKRLQFKTIAKFDFVPYGDEPKSIFAGRMLGWNANALERFQIGK